MVKSLLKLTPIWETLQGSKLPIVLYGMGDGGDKMLRACRRFDIPVAGVFASDGFVRGQRYQGFVVETLAEAETRLGDFIVLLSFATSLPDVMDHIMKVARRHTLYAPDLPVCGDTLFTMDFFHSRLEDAQLVYDLLADEASKSTYLQILSHKLTGKIDFLIQCQRDKAEAWRLLAPGTDAFFVDAGAYTGDTVAEFLEAAGGTCRGVLALEPDRRNFRKLEAAARSLAPLDIDCRNVGAWSHRDTLPFQHKSGRQAGLGDAGVPTPVDSIDNLLEGRAPTLIKYDVEGAEAQALSGSAAAIARYRPDLIVSAYHRSEDLLDLPLQISKLHPGCRIYLRHHPYIPGWDTNLYAISFDRRGQQV